MKFLILLAILVTISIIPNSFAETYDKFGISLEYPKDWTYEEKFNEPTQVLDKIFFRDQNKHYLLTVERWTLSNEESTLSKNNEYIEKQIDDMKLECSKSDRCQNRIGSYHFDNDKNIGYLNFEAKFSDEYGDLLQKSTTLFFDNSYWTIRYSADPEDFMNFESFFDSTVNSLEKLDSAFPKTNQKSQPTSIYDPEYIFGFLLRNPIVIIAIIVIVAIPFFIFKDGYRGSGSSYSSDTTTYTDPEEDISPQAKRADAFMHHGQHEVTGQYLDKE